MVPLLGIAKLLFPEVAGKREDLNSEMLWSASKDGIISRSWKQKVKITSNKESGAAKIEY